MHAHTKTHKPVTQVAYLNINIHTAMNNLYIKIFSMYDYIWDNLIFIIIINVITVAGNILVAHNEQRIKVSHVITIKCIVILYVHSV